MTIIWGHVELCVGDTHTSRSPSSALKRAARPRAGAGPSSISDYYVAVHSFLKTQDQGKIYLRQRFRRPHAGTAGCG